MARWRATPRATAANQAGFGVEPMKIAVEDDRHRRIFSRSQPLDGGQRVDIAVEPAGDIKRIGGKILRAGEDLGRIAVIERAEAAGAIFSLLRKRERREEKERSFRRLFQCAAAARTLAGGAAVAMPGDADRVAGDVFIEQIRKVHAFTRAVR